MKYFSISNKTDQENLTINLSFDHVPNTIWLMSHKAMKMNGPLREHKWKTAP